MNSITYLIRRLLIILVLIALVFNLIFLFLAFKASKTKLQINFYQMNILIEDSKIADLTLNKLKTSRFEAVLTRKYPGSKRVPNGYIVVQYFSQSIDYKKLINAFNERNFKARLVKDFGKEKVKIQIGGIFHAETQAKELVKHISITGINFKVENNYRFIPKLFNKIEIKQLKKEQIEKLKKEYKNHQIQIIPVKNDL
ncbi:MAG: hypothetical protein HYU63_05150 [Armatimonadetes bacterium]|nr:hypothetical protein [Armatimonadota bacterium]